MQYILLIVKLLPLAIQLVQMLEATLPAGTPGTAKMDAVKNGLTSVVAAEGIAAPLFEQAWPALHAVTSSMVDTFQKHGTSNGEFKPTATVAAEPIPQA